MTSWINFELNILNSIQNIANPSLDSFFVNISALGNASIFWIALTILCLTSKEYKKMGKVMVIGFILNLLVVNLLLKNIVARIRPYNYIENIKLLVPALNDGSFPSGHTSYAFTYFAIVLSMSKNKSLKIFIGIVALLIAISRLYLYVHFPTDIIGGAIIGILIGKFAIKVYSSNKFVKFFKFLSLQSS